MHLGTFVLLKVNMLEKNVSDAVRMEILLMESLTQEQRLSNPNETSELGKSLSSSVFLLCHWNMLIVTTAAFTVCLRK